MPAAEDVRRSSPLFRRLAEEDLERLASIAVTRSYEKGDALFSEGDVPCSTAEDLGSKKGTSLNGERVCGTRELRDGDAVRLGEVQLLFRSLPFDGSTATEGG